MRLGISSYTYTWSVGAAGHPPPSPMTAVGLLEKAAELGVGVVQVADNLPLAELAGDELDAFAARAEQLGVQVEVGTRGTEPGHLRRYLELAERLGSRILRVVADTSERHPSPHEIVADVRTVAGELERAGVTLALENHERLRSAELADVVHRTESEHVGICLDTVNSLGALEGPDAVLDALGPLTVNLHVKDFDVRRVEHMMGFAIEGRPAGQGRLDIPGLLLRLRDLGRDPNAILELWTPPADGLAATIRREQDWAASSVAYLRGLIRD
jgi:sugar phosphate isomerase/epimerase